MDSDRQRNSQTSQDSSIYTLNINIIQIVIAQRQHKTVIDAFTGDGARNFERYASGFGQNASVFPLTLVKRKVKKKTTDITNSFYFYLYLYYLLDIFLSGVNVSK